MVDTTPDCPQCPHPAAEHGTWGCLFGWERARYTESIIKGCRCNERHVGDRAPGIRPTRTLPTFSLPYPKETAG